MTRTQRGGAAARPKLVSAGSRGRLESAPRNQGSSAILCGKANAGLQPMASAAAHEQGRLNAGEIVDQLLANLEIPAFDDVPQRWS